MSNSFLDRISQEQETLAGLKGDERAAYLDSIREEGAKRTDTPFLKKVTEEQQRLQELRTAIQEDDTPENRQALETYLESIQGQKVRASSQSPLDEFIRHTSQLKELKIALGNGLDLGSTFSEHSAGAIAINASKIMRDENALNTISESTQQTPEYLKTLLASIRTAIEEYEPKKQELRVGTKIRTCKRSSQGGKPRANCRCGTLIILQRTPNPILYNPQDGVFY